MRKKQLYKKKANVLLILGILVLAFFVFYQSGGSLIKVSGTVSIDGVLTFDDNTTEEFNGESPLEQILDFQGREVTSITGKAYLKIQTIQQVQECNVNGVFEAWLDNKELSNVTINNNIPLTANVRTEIASITLDNLQENATEPTIKLTVPELTAIVTLTNGETYKLTLKDPAEATIDLSDQHVSDQPSDTDTSTFPSLLVVVGNKLQNQEGEIVQLQGVNQPGFVDCPSGFWRPEGGSTFSGLGEWNPDAVKANLDEIASWGANCIRMHQVGQYWIENTDTREGTPVGQAYKDNLKDIIEWAGERGLYYIFDYYCDYPYPNDYQDPLPYGQSGSLFTTEAEFVNYWSEVAEYLKSYPNVLFEIFNEPHSPATKEQYFTMAQDCINAIRQAGAKQPIIIQWDYSIWTDLDYPHNGQGDGTLDWIWNYPLSDPQHNIVYSFHIYRGPWAQIHDSSGALYQYEDIKAGFEDCAVYTASQQYPILIGEFGAYYPDDRPEEVTFFASVCRIAEEWGLNYIAWVWDTVGHMSFPLLDGGAWIPPPNSAGEVLISYFGGQTSLNALVTPSEITVYPSTSADFTCSVTGGVPPYSYSWRLNETEVSTSASYTFVGSEHALGYYVLYCRVSDGTGTVVESNHAKIYLTEEPVAEPFIWHCEDTVESDGHWRAYDGSVSVVTGYSGNGLRFDVQQTDPGYWTVLEKESPYTSTRQYWYWKGLSTITFKYKTNHPELPVVVYLRIGPEWTHYKYTASSGLSSSDTWYTLSIDISGLDDNGNYPDLTLVAAIDFYVCGDTAAPSDLWYVIDEVEGT